MKSLLFYLLVTTDERIGGILICIAGLWWSFKVLDRVYLQRGWNVNRAVAEFFGGAIVFLAGGCLIIQSLGGWQ